MSEWLLPWIAVFGALSIGSWNVAFAKNSDFSGDFYKFVKP